MKRMTVAGLVVLALFLPLAAQPVGLPAAKVEAIEKAVSSEMSRQNIPGLSVAVAAGGQRRWAGGFGLADLENFVPAKRETVYRLASISKPITAVAVMQLVEQGKIDLDAPVQKYVPYFPRKQWTLTVRHLLMHQGGVRHYRNDGEMQSTRHYDALREALQLFQDDPLLFEPGTRYLYTTYGYTLLGAAVEGASGMSFVDYIHKHIFEPAGMRTIRPDDTFEIIPNRARGYRKVLGRIQNSALADTSNKIPGGGLCSAVEDLVDFGIHVLGRTLAGRETLEAMFTRRKTADGKLTPYGMGWQFGDFDGKRWVGHGGSQPGTRTLLLMLPSEGFVVALMANLEGVQLEPLAKRVAAIVLKQED